MALEYDAPDKGMISRLSKTLTISSQLNLGSRDLGSRLHTYLAQNGREIGYLLASAVVKHQ